MKIKNYLIKILIVLFLIIPYSGYAYSQYVIPGGQTIGIEVNSKGILVVGFYKVNGEYIAKDAGFKEKDIIIEVNDMEVISINSMVNAIKNTESETIKFTVLRNNNEKAITLKLKSKDEEVLKTGLYVKDKINGIGTLSYVDPETKIFGSLGHEILESNTISKFEIKDGQIYDARVTSIVRSKIGSAGEKNASYNKEKIYGDIKENETTGIYGKYTHEIPDTEKIEVGDSSAVTTGPATIRTVINENKIEDFTINIIKITTDNNTKNILFEITDERLISKTGGIVQGMSGSPIIQNNKLIGAVNYVIVNDPTKGYGIFITTMLKEGEN